MNGKDRVNPAFTLVELLIAFAIVAIIAAIVFPVLAQARETARMTQCASNLRQIGLAMRMYVDDFDEQWFPAQSESYAGPGVSLVQPWIGYDNQNTPNGGDDDKPATHPPRPGALDPYIRSEGLKRCPSMPQDWQLSYALNFWSPADVNQSEYYKSNPGAAMNEYGPSSRLLGIDHATSTTLCIGAQDSDIDDPADTMVVWEHQYELPDCNFLQPYDWYSTPPNIQSLRDHFHFLHRGGCNALWADGHVKHMRYEQLSRPMFSCRKDIYP